MRFITGLMLAGALVVLANFVFIYIAVNVDDGVVESYETETR